MSLPELQTRFKTLLSATIYVIFAFFTLTPILYTFLIIFMLKGTYDKLTREKIKWAPLFVPMRRRMETLVLGILAFQTFFIFPLTINLSIVLLFYLNNFWRIVIIGCWIYCYYEHYTKFSVLDGMGWKNLRTCSFGRYVRSYFPVDLVKTAELKPNKNYILACFPHGILCIGPTVNCIVDIRKWLELFPGIRPKLSTLDINLCIPSLRNYMMLYGYTSSSKESLLYYLNKSNDPKHEDNQDGFSSYAIAIAVGGAKEASETQPGHYKLMLKNRKGFVKIAIMSGASIVPSFTFNEVDSYDQIFAEPDSWTYRFQNLIKSITGIWPSMVVGRGFFQYTFGILPRRNHLVQVVGAPIPVEKCDKPEPAYVDEIHKKVIEAIQELFDTHKHRYLQTYKDAKLIIT